MPLFSIRGGLAVIELRRMVLLVVVPDGRSNTLERRHDVCIRCRIIRVNVPLARPQWTCGSGATEFQIGGAIRMGVPEALQAQHVAAGGGATEATRLLDPRERRAAKVCAAAIASADDLRIVAFTALPLCLR